MGGGGFASPVRTAGPGVRVAELDGRGRRGAGLGPGERDLGLNRPDPSKNGREGEMLC